ncbi:MAG TPA: DUF3575 domain-containing protein [Cytophaga sp.]|jgi:hypothetical protein|nr:DUF3575 domain-containing protein [Cytophaga sp.]
MSKSSNFFKTVVLGVILFGFNNILSAQNDTEFKAKKNSFKISPTAFIASTFALSYERYVGESVTLQLTGGLMAASKNSGSNTYYNGTNYVTYSDKDKASGGLVDLSLKYYFLKGKSVMSGLYAGPYARYSKNSFEINGYTTTGIATYTQTKYSITSYEGGAVFGWQWVAGNAFVIDMYVGGGLKVSNNTAPPTYDRDNRSFSLLESQDYTGITPKAGFRLGFVF